MSFVPYKVDHSIQNTAKTLGFSKKRVSFKFGFASFEAIDRGEGGAGCRGSEHEITFVWSLKTGKRQLFVDGRDVHYSESGMNGWTVDRAWNHSFPLKDSATGHTYKIHFISQVVNPEIPGMHPFDLRIQGVSYFNFNDIWQLGTGKMVTREINFRNRNRDLSGGRGEPPPGRENSTGLSAEEERQIALAKVASLKDYDRDEQKRKAAAAPAAAATTNDLLSFDAPPAEVQVPGSTGAYPGAPPPQQQPAFAAAPAAYGAYPPAPAPAYSNALVAAPAPSYGAPAPYPGAPPPAAYGGAPAPYGAMPPTDGGVYQQPPPAQQPPAYGGAYGGAYGAPAPATPANGTGAPNFASPGAQSSGTYGSAPTFAKPADQQPPFGGGPGTAFAYPPAPVGAPPQTPPPPAAQNPFGGF